MDLTYELAEDLETLSQEDLESFCRILYQWYKIYYSPGDPPPIEAVKRDILSPNEPHAKLLSIVAKNNGLLVAIARIFINESTENQHRASVRIVTKTEYQKQGIAKRVLKYILENLPDVITTISTHIRNDGYSSGELSWLDNKLTEYGGKMSLLDRKSGAILENFTCSEVNKIAINHRERVEHEGYSFIFVDNYEFPQEFDMDDYLKSVEEIWNDMPRDEMDANDERLTKEDYTQLISYYRARFYKIWMYVCLKDNKTVGLTLSMIDKLQPSIVVQDDTGVIREHRGHGLGVALKYQMLEKLMCDPESKGFIYWITHNAHSNSHMIRINNELKYEEMATFVLYEFKKEELLEKLGYVRDN